MDIGQQEISTQHKIFWPSDWMAWEQSLEALAFRRGSIHLKYIEPHQAKIINERFFYTSLSQFPAWDTIMGFQF